MSGTKEKFLVTILSTVALAVVHAIASRGTHHVIDGILKRKNTKSDLTSKNTETSRAYKSAQTSNSDVTSDVVIDDVDSSDKKYSLQISNMWHLEKAAKELGWIEKFSNTDHNGYQQLFDSLAELADQGGTLDIVQYTNEHIDVIFTTEDKQTSRSHKLYTGN